MAFSQLQSRVITATILVAAFVGLLVLSAASCLGHWLLMFVAMAAQILCAFEFARISASQNARRFTAYSVICIIPGLAVLLLSLREGVCSPSLFSFVPFALATGVFVSIVAATIFILWHGRENIQIAKDVAVELYPGLLLIGLGGGSLVGLAGLPNAAWIVSWLFLVVCLNDIAAYFGGSYLKGARVAPALSPNKTISGCLCGMAAGVLAGVCAGRWLGFGAPMLFFFFLSFLVVITAQTGDLLKSYVKRHVGVKDSGSILPGHGGLLDRLDGVLFSGPLVYLVVVWMLRL